MQFILYVDSRRLYCRTPEADSGANFQRNDSDSGRKVGVTSRKSELLSKSESYSWAHPQNQNRIAQKKGPEWGLGAFTETPLKAFLNPPN